jgi:hypothetical protein
VAVAAVVHHLGGGQVAGGAAEVVDDDVRPSVSCSGCCSARLVTSATPPAGKAMTRRTGLLRQAVYAWSGEVAAKVLPSEAARARRRVV